MKKCRNWSKSSRLLDDILLTTCFGTNNVIDANDVQAWVTNYLSNLINLDINTDNSINGFEFGYLVAHWGQACQ